MTVAAAVFAALVLGFAVTARWLSRVYVTAPITFVAAGAVISAVTPSTTARVAEVVKVVAEVTLALILFHDAAQVRPRQIKADRGLIVRLLLVGLPLTVVFGFVAARVAFPAMPATIALLLAAALARICRGHRVHRGGAVGRRGALGAGPDGGAVRTIGIRCVVDLRSCRVPTHP